MHLSELQNKNVVNIVDGKNIGTIIDVKINKETGFIETFVVEQSTFFSFARNSNIEIKWSSITMIGEDVILVNLNQ